MESEAETRFVREIRRMYQTAYSFSSAGSRLLDDLGLRSCGAPKKLLKLRLCDDTEDGTPVDIFDINALHAPFIVCHALAVEVLLKCLVRLEGLTIPRGRSGHRLSALFGLLTPESKISIKESFDRAREDDPGYRVFKEFISYELAFVLKQNDDAFVNWRYCYEDGNKGWGTLGVLFAAVRERVVELMPEAKNWTPNSGRAMSVEP